MQIKIKKYTDNQQFMILKCKFIFSAFLK